MSKINLVLLLSTFVIATLAQHSNSNDLPPTQSLPYDDIVVGSSLNVRQKQPNRQVRSILLEEIPQYLIFAPQGRLYRSKRQFGNNGFGSSSALANAASQNQHFGPQGFGGAAAAAQGQAFESHGPLGGFGASATGAQTQAFNAGPGGIQGAGGISGGQTYNLPGGQTLSATYGGTYAVGPDGRPTLAQSNSVGFSG